MQHMRTLGNELERSRTSLGMSVEDAAAKCGCSAEVWRALEAEDAAHFALTPNLYASAARALRRRWVLTSG